jgi:hypothetical protein
MKPNSNLSDLVKKGAEHLNAVTILWGVVIAIAGWLFWITNGVKTDIGTAKNEVIQEMDKRIIAATERWSKSESDTKATFQQAEALLWLVERDAAGSDASCRADYSVIISDFATIKKDPRFISAHSDNGQRKRIRNKIIRTVIIAYEGADRFAAIPNDEYDLFAGAIDDSRSQACAIAAHFSYCLLLLSAKRFADANRECAAGLEQIALLRATPANCAGCGASGDSQSYAKWGERYTYLIVVTDIAARSAVGKGRGTYHNDGGLVVTVCGKLEITMDLDTVASECGLELAPVVRHLALREIPSLAENLEAVIKEWSKLVVQREVVAVSLPNGQVGSGFRYRAVKKTPATMLEASGLAPVRVGTGSISADPPKGKKGGVKEK